MPKKGIFKLNLISKEKIKENVKKRKQEVREQKTKTKQCFKQFTILRSLRDCIIYVFLCEIKIYTEFIHHLVVVGSSTLASTKAICNNKL